MISLFKTLPISMQYFTSYQFLVSTVPLSLSSFISNNPFLVPSALLSSCPATLPLISLFHNCFPRVIWHLFMSAPFASIFACSNIFSRIEGAASIWGYFQMGAAHEMLVLEGNSYLLITVRLTTGKSRVQDLAWSFQRLKKWYPLPSCMVLDI